MGGSGSVDKVTLGNESSGVRWVQARDKWALSSDGEKEEGRKGPAREAGGRGRGRREGEAAQGVTSKRWTTSESELQKQTTANVNSR